MDIYDCQDQVTIDIYSDDTDEEYMLIRILMMMTWKKGRWESSGDILLTMTMFLKLMTMVMFMTLMIMMMTPRLGSTRGGRAEVMVRATTGRRAGSRKG